MIRAPGLALGCVAVVCAAAPRLARAEGGPCRVVDTLGSSALSPPWRSAVESLEREVAGASASDCHGVELIITEDRDGLRVTAKAQDGRETSRHVAVPSGLSAVAFGLLAAAPAEEAPVPLHAPAELPPRDVQPRDVPPRDPSPRDLPPAVDAPRRPPPPPPPGGITFSAATGIRGVFPTDVLIADFDVRADLAVNDWLVTFGVRAAPLVLAMRGPYDVDAYDEASVGLGLGRQLRRGRSVFALTGGASVAYVWVENDSLNLSAERAQLRLAAIARWSYPAGARVRFCATLDGEVSPTGLVNGFAGAGLARFPAFTAGFRLGAEVVL